MLSLRGPSTAAPFLRAAGFSTSCNRSWDRKPYSTPTEQFLVLLCKTVEEDTGGTETAWLPSNKQQMSFCMSSVWETLQQTSVLQGLGSMKLEIGSAD